MPLIINANPAFDVKAMTLKRDWIEALSDFKANPPPTQSNARHTSENCEKSIIMFRNQKQFVSRLRYCRAWLCMLEKMRKAHLHNPNMKNVAISQGINYTETRCNLFMILSTLSTQLLHFAISYVYVDVASGPFSVFGQSGQTKGSCLRVASIYALALRGEGRRVHLWDAVAS